MGVANVLAGILGGDSMFANVFVVMLVLALLLSVMTTMAGSSRTLYQGSIDGMLPAYLSKVNEQGAPTAAMWTNLIVNLVLLSMSDYVFLLAASNVGYIIFNFLNLNAGWIHRLDRPNWERPYRAPTVLIAIGTLLSYVNMVLMGMGANVWGKGTLMSGILLALLVIPIFIWRHYLVDKGIFPKAMREDMSLDENGGDIICRAGILPYLVLLAGILIVFFSSLLVADL
jgi:amino acid transporter